MGEIDLEGKKFGQLRVIERDDDPLGAVESDSG
jgi:hypothetical protein